MSELQDNPALIQQHRQQQQRQILAMMGIQQWIQPQSPTLVMADIPALSMTASLTVEQPVATVPMHDYHHAHLQNPVVIDDSNIDMPHTHHLSEDNVIEVSSEVTVNTDDAVAKIYHIDRVSKVATSDVSPINSDELSASIVQATVAPFDLQGGCFGSWVLIVDIQSLTHDSQKLWQNMVHALSLSCENTSFPHCAGMDTVELANASLSGFLFKVGRREDSKVAALTALPKGISHPYLISVPTLDDMLNNSRLKREFWAQISNE